MESWQRRCKEQERGMKKTNWNCDRRNAEMPEEIAFYKLSNKEEGNKDKKKTLEHIYQRHDWL